MRASVSVRRRTFARREHFVVFKRGGMGSVMASIPFVARLRECFPESHILFVTDQVNMELVERCGVADEVVSIDTGSDEMPGWRLARLIARMRRTPPAAFFDLQLHTYRRVSALLAAVSKASLCVGFLRSGDRLRPRLFNTLVIGNMFAPVQDLYLQMARAIGCPMPGHFPAAPPLVTSVDRREAQRVLGSWFEPQHRLLVVNPNTSAKAIERRWPLGQFAAAVSAIIAQRDDVRVVLIGSADETEFVERLRRSLGDCDGRVRSLAGRTNLGGLLAVLRRANCVLTNDSGPFHFAVALGTPTVGLFGPVHPDHYGRMGDPERTVVFYRPMVCSPCVHFVRTPPCRGDNQCMKSIDAVEVRDACLMLLDGARREADSGWQFSVSPQTSARDGGALGVWRQPDVEEAPHLGFLAG